MEFSVLIRDARKAQEWSQRELAELIGCTTGFITKLEKGDALPSYERCLALANALQLSLDELWVLVEEGRRASHRNRLHARNKMINGNRQMHKGKRHKDIVATVIKEGCESIARALSEIAEALRNQ